MLYRAVYLFIYLFIYLQVYFFLTNPMEQSSFEKLTVTQLVKKFPYFYGTRRFIFTFTRPVIGP
jgi:hypothetical protein